MRSCSAVQCGGTAHARLDIPFGSLNPPGLVVKLEFRLIFQAYVLTNARLLANC
jgi:hypothetical protein